MQDCDNVGPPMKGDSEQAAMDAQLQAATVENLTYEQLEKTFYAKETADETSLVTYLEGVIAKTDDEEWRAQWETLQDLRVLNKFSQSFLDSNLNKF